MIKSIGSNWILTILQVVVTFTLLPFTIRTLGETQYGTWILIASVTSYLSMLALGVPMATVRFVANYAGAGDHAALNRTVGSCAGLYLLIGLGSAIIGTGLFFAFDSLYEVEPALLSQARWAFAIVVLNISASFIGQLPYGIMSAHHEFMLRNQVQMGSILLKLGLTVGLLSWHASFVWLAIIQLTLFALEFSVATWLVRRRWPHIRIRLSDFDPAMVRQIFGFSLFVMLLSIGAQLTFQSDAIVIGAFLPVETIPLFTVAGSLAVYLMEFVIGIGSVVMPMAAALQAKGRTDEVRDIFLKWSKITVSLTFAACLFLLVLGPRFMGWWIGPEFEQPAGRVLQILMLGNLVFLPVRGVALPLLMGLGKPKAPAIAFLVSGVLNVLMSVVLVQRWGLDGVAVGTAVPNLLFALVVLHWAARELRVTIPEYLGYAFGRTLLASVPVIGLLWWCRDVWGVRTLPELFVAGVASVTLFGVIAVYFVYRGDPHTDVRSMIAQRLAARRG